MYRTGEIPGEGTFNCTTCGRLDDNADLPPCPKCTETTYHKGQKNTLNYFAKSNLGRNI